MCFSIFAGVHPQHLQIKDFSYLLPEERIARYPLAERDVSKLLIYQHSNITESTYRHLADYLPQNSLLVFNNTKVIHARLFFKTATGARIEIFCLDPAEGNIDMASVMSRKKSVRWNCMVGRLAKWKEKALSLQTSSFNLSAEMVERRGEILVVEFKWLPEQLSFAEILDQVGILPIPPYLKRESEAIDSSRYQTVYAQHNGSVAAPTAGLHFTPAIFETLNAKNILCDELTLHVGAGTFKPVKTATLHDHPMHEERIQVSTQNIENICRATTGQIIAVGTTTLRTLETLYWMGLKAKLNPQANIQELEINQWDPYDLSLQAAATLSAKESLQALIAWMKNQQIETLFCKTQILIAPPYRLKVCSALITNFHQPNSTLLLLVAAVVKDNWKQIYQYALQNNFRFLSYGDGSLLFAE